MIKDEILQIAENFKALSSQDAAIEDAVNLCVNALENGNKIIFCGNGGSASQAQHLTAELVGRYKMERKALDAISLTVDTSNLTAIGNDYGFENIFSRQLEGVGKMGDVLFGLSTSGNSENVVRAFKLAKEMGIFTIALVGAKDCKMEEMADLTIKVPAQTSNNIQEMHLAVGHIICGEIEKRIFA
ncbi:MAG: SIS domain-containing protein [Alphaproteobacteria bacterium]|nr:SIS domain-containing protein [Alphaproteobacteria bacterium]